MKIKKRSGELSSFMPNKILNRIKEQAKGLKVNSDYVFQKVIPSIQDEMTTTQIDEIIAFKCNDLTVEHPDYSILAARVLLTRQAKLLGVTLEEVDRKYDFLGAVTFLKSYSVKKGKDTPIEIPSMMYDRVANHLGETEEDIKELSIELKAKRVSLATPVLSNSATKRQALISCFTKDTLVNTDKGLVKISEIKKGDLVLTHKNRFRSVNEVYENPLLDRSVKTVKVYRTKEIKCTDNHEFLSYTTEDERLGLEPSFKPIKWLRVGDFVKGGYAEDSIRISSFIKPIGDDFFYRITDIQTIEIQDEFVYDLNVEEDHSYSVENIVVHNCNLTHLIDDSLEGIEQTKYHIAKASKEGAGIGLLIDPIRSKDTLVESFQGYASGLVRLADMVQSTMRFYKQGTRSGSCALYLSVWHKDVMDFLKLTLNQGSENMRTRDLQTAVIIDDIFMNCLINGDTYYTFCPHVLVKAGLKPLYELAGKDFEAEYNKAVELGLGTAVEAKDIWNAIISAQVESGTPYVFFKDNANKKNMQENIGIVRQSNLCVAPETLILTKEGYQEIAKLENQEVEVWNGKQWSSTKVVKTGENQKLITIHYYVKDCDTMTTWYKTLRCTEYHKWYILGEDGQEKKVEAKDLKIGDFTIDYINPFTGNKLSSIITYVSESTNDDTYCVNEPLENKVVFNGVLTGNCIEITQVSKPLYTPQCALGLIPLPFHDSLESIAKSTKVLVKALNRVIDVNKWSDEASKAAGEDQRAIAIGIGGLAEFFAQRKLSFTSEEARKWNRDIMETMYKAALEASMELAIKKGVNYPAWEGSPYSKGKTLIEGWNPLGGDAPIPMANSLLIGLMPSAGTSMILGISESFEPFSSNMFTRTVGNGQFTVVNKWLVKDLEDYGMWDKQMSDLIAYYGGSIQDIDIIPQEIKERYRIVTEIPQKALIDMAIDRQQFIDQSQSLNLYFPDASYTKISSALMHGWKNGMKTGSYYMKTEKKSEKAKRLYKIDLPERPNDSIAQCFGCSS